MPDDDRPLIPPPRKPGLFAALRASFLAGLVVILPIALTVWLLWAVTGFIDGWVLPLVPYRFRPEHYIGINLRGVGVIFALIFTVLIGFFARGFLGRTLLAAGESLIDRTPVVRSVYSGIKQIAETIFSQNETKFERACLVEYPRPGVWAIGFVSTGARGEIADHAPEGDPFISVFVPRTPNPTTGLLIYVPESELRYLDMSIEDAAKLVISAGLVAPPARPASPFPATPTETEAK